jgi:hypothetical protein
VTFFSNKNGNHDYDKNVREQEPTSSGWREIFHGSLSPRPMSTGESFVPDECAPVDANVTAVPSYDKVCPYEGHYQIRVQLGR